MALLSIFERIRRAVTGERVVESIRVTQQFPTYGLLPETYIIEFVDNWFGQRSLRVNASAFCQERKLWVGTELYVFTIVPWMDGLMSNNDLTVHINTLKDISDVPVKRAEIRGDMKNIIDFQRHFKKKKKDKDKTRI